MTLIPNWTQKVLPINQIENQSLINRKISLALLAYAAGDALGVQYEFIKEKPKVSTLSIQPKDGWPFGGVSDDTLLSLITISCLEEKNPEVAAKLFLERLRLSIPKLRGLGPTTRSALGLPVSEAEVGQVGNTNGAMMRTALCGIAFLPSESSIRNEWIMHSASSTHMNQNAVYSALLLSGIFSNLAVENLSTDIDIYDVAKQTFIGLKSIPEELKSAIINLDKWSPPDTGITLDPIETLLAVLWVAKGARSFQDVYIRACELGGDTDTVAALSAALYAVKTGDFDEFLEMEWLSDIQWDEVGNLESQIKLITENRGI